MSYAAPDMGLRVRIAGEFLGADATFDQPWGGFCRCPHGHLHSKSKSNPRECRVYLEGAPTVHCFHASCASALVETNAELRRRIRDAERGGAVSSTPMRRAMPRPPVADKPARVVDISAALRVAETAPAICATEAWWRSVSPLDPDGVMPETFLDAIFQAGDRIMVTTNKQSTGDFIWVAGSPGRAFRLSKQRGVKAVPADRLPRAGRGGVMFSVNCVDGQWHRTGAIDPVSEMERMGRRGKAAFVRFPHMLLESDVLDPEVWLRVLSILPFPIVAVIATGGRGHHAIVRLPNEPPSLPEFEWFVRQTEPVLSKVGADWQAMGVTKSSRLPQCARLPDDYHGDWSDLKGMPRQRLIFLNPYPEIFPTHKLHVQRSITET